MSHWHKYQIELFVNSLVRWVRVASVGYGVSMTYEGVRMTYVVVSNYSDDPGDRWNVAGAPHSRTV